MNSIDVKTCRGTLIGRKNENAFVAVAKGRGKSGRDGNKVVKIPIWLASVKWGSDKDLQ